MRPDASNHLVLVGVRAGNLDVIANHDVQVQHRGFHVAVAEHFLDDAITDMVEQQVGREQMTKRVGRDGFADVCLFDGFIQAHGKSIAIKMVAVPFARCRITGKIVGRK